MMGFLSLLSSTLFLSLALGSPLAKDRQRGSESQTEPPIPKNVLRPGQPVPANLVRDRTTLLAFATKVTKDPTGDIETWHGEDPCTYNGVYCDYPLNSRLAVASIDFAGFKLAGSRMTVTGLLDKLLDLALFHINSNSFTGKLPDNLDQLRFLREIDVSNNKLTGPIPSNLPPILEWFDIRFNQFEGSVPDDLFTLPELSIIAMDFNKLSGSLPSVLGTAASEQITLNFNEFSGSLPSSLGNMPRLKTLQFMRNKLSGSLPTDVKGVQALEWLDFGDNQFTGSVPEALCLLPKLKVLNLMDNKLTGTLGPACLELYRKKILFTSGNCITNVPRQKPGCGLGNDHTTPDVKFVPPKGGNGGIIQ